MTLLSPMGSSRSGSGCQFLFLVLRLSILFLRSSPLIISDDLSIIEVANGSSSQLRISLRCVFIPLLPPITGLVGGAVPLLLSQSLWSLNSSHSGQASNPLLSMLSLHLASCLLSLPTWKIFSSMLTAPLMIFWLLFLSSRPTSVSSFT